MNQGEVKTQKTKPEIVYKSESISKENFKFKMPQMQ